MLRTMSFASGAGPRGPTASRALLAAGLGGLLCLGLAACGSSGPANPNGRITSSKLVPNMTVDTFTQMCDDRGGKVEVIVECGGSNSCKGMSWDQGAQTLTEHTCKAMNTCAGYSCVVPS